MSDHACTCRTAYRTALVSYARSPRASVSAYLVRCRRAGGVLLLLVLLLHATTLNIHLSGSFFMYTCACNNNSYSNYPAVLALSVGFNKEFFLTTCPKLQYIVVVPS